MDNPKEAYVEIIDFKRFPQKMKYGSIGMVFGKVTHGLTTNFFSELIHEFQLDAEGNSSGLPSSMSVTKIAFATAFNSPTHFLTTYRVRFGVSPSDQKSKME